MGIASARRAPHELAPPRARGARFRGSGRLPAAAPSRPRRRRRRSRRRRRWRASRGRSSTDALTPSPTRVCWPSASPTEVAGRRARRRHGRPRRTFLHRWPGPRELSRAGGSGRLSRGRDLTGDGAGGGVGPARRRRGAIDLRPGGAFGERAGRGRAGRAGRRGGRPGARDASAAPTAASPSAASARDVTPCAPRSGRGVSATVARGRRQPRRRTTSAALVSGAGATIGGRLVQDAGAGLAGFEVRAESAALPPGDDPLPVVARTDRIGAFTLGPLAAGSYRVTARRPATSCAARRP